MYVVSFIVITYGISQMSQTLKCERAPAPDATLKPRRRLQRHSACKLLNREETLLVKTSYLRLYSTCHTKSPQPQKIIFSSGRGSQLQSHQEGTAPDATGRAKPKLKHFPTRNSRAADESGENWRSKQYRVTQGFS